MKKTINPILIFIIVVVSLTLSSAVSIEPVKQGNSALLYQTCNNCTFCNITNVKNPNNISLMSNIPFDKDGTYYTKILSGSNTTVLGTYSYFYYCGNELESQTGKVDFQVTPSGREGNDNMVFIIILLVFIYVITFVSFFGKNIPLSIMTGAFMSYFGVWIIQNGIVIYRDNLTIGFGYITMAIGAIISLYAAIEWIEEIF